MVTDQEGRGDAFAAFLERAKSGLVVRALGAIAVSRGYYYYYYYYNYFCFCDYNGDDSLGGLE